MELKKLALREIITIVADDVDGSLFRVQNNLWKSSGVDVKVGKESLDIFNLSVIDDGNSDRDACGCW